MMFYKHLIIKTEYGYIYFALLLGRTTRLHICMNALRLAKSMRSTLVYTHYIKLNTKLMLRKNEAHHLWWTSVCNKVKLGRRPHLLFRLMFTLLSMIIPTVKYPEYAESQALNCVNIQQQQFRRNA